MADPQFFDDGVLSVTTDAGTSVAIAGIQGVTITPGFEIAELYTADSVLREAVKQYEHGVSVEINYSIFDIAAAQEWLGGAGGTATATADTSDPQLFTVERVENRVGGTPEITTTVEKVVFPEFPLIDGSQGEYVEWNLSGTGRSITQHADTTPV